MINENLENFFKNLLNSPAFREKFAAAKTAKEGYIMAKPYIGENVSFDEFKSVLTKIHNKKDYKSRLLNNALDKISGGTDDVDRMFIDLINM